MFDIGASIATTPTKLTAETKSIMDFFVDAPPQAKKFIEAIVPSMLEQLKLTRSRKLLMIRVERDCEDPGITLDLTELSGCYLVVLKKDRDWDRFGLTLAHELVHVKQMAKGIMRTDDRGTFYWRGQAYNQATAYLDRPWEVQAFSCQELILRRALV